MSKEIENSDVEIGKWMRYNNSHSWLCNDVVRSMMFLYTKHILETLKEEQ